MRAVLFPGQGSQYVGMGAEFYNKFDSVKKNFEIVNRALGFPISDLILNGPEEKLKLTENTQPAIMVVGVSIFNVLNEKFNFKLEESKFFAGHSLGEYTALVCAGALSLEKAAYLLNERGKAMQEAAPEGSGAMTAILGMSIDEVEKEIALISKIGTCEIANDNSNAQIVVSGNKNAIESLNENLKKGYKINNLGGFLAKYHKWPRVE